MKATRWLAIAAIAGGAAYTAKGCLNRPAPDQKLAGQLDDLCDIARDGAEKPVAGVKALGRYMVKHGGDLLENFGNTIAVIERIADDEAHDERARMARDRIQGPLRACERDWQRFGQAIDRDPEAAAMMERAMMRLNRTLEILFGGKRVTLDGLPRQLEQLVDGVR